MRESGHITNNYLNMATVLLFNFDKIPQFAIPTADCHDDLIGSITTANDIKDSYMRELGMRLHIQSLIEKLLNNLETPLVSDNNAGMAKNIGKEDSH